MSIPSMKRIVEPGERSEGDEATVADANDCMDPDGQIEENNTKIGEDDENIQRLSKRWFKITISLKIDYSLNLV